jgi:CxxC motif-containing protein (DUF1111 family)
MSKQASTLGRLRQPLLFSATHAAMFSLAIGLAACGNGGDSGTGDATLATPVVVSPGADQAYTPLYTADTAVIEQIQYTEADGTLVTLAGFRPTNRHARERGEPWMDAADVGPGNFLTFPTFYFQNRTYGLVIRDEVPAGRQKITAYLKPNVGTFINNGFSAFRRVDPDVIEYGWKDNTGFTNLQENNTRCHAGDNLAGLCAAPPITDNWRSGDDGTSSVLKVGDKIEMSPAQFLDNTDGVHALIDGGGIRYYSLEQLYVVGKGLVPWYGIAPRLDSSPLPAETLLGGMASASYNYSEEPNRVFQQPVNNIGIADMQRFVEGRRLFHTSFADGRHSESPDINPVFTAHANQLGARYNQTRCIECHTLNGRSVAATIGVPLTSMSVLTAAADSTGAAPKPDATYGYNVQQRSNGAGADYSVTVASYKTSTRTLAGGETVELQQPVYAFKGPVPAQFSVRQAPQVIGMGLLEAVDETTILALARNGDADGVRGVPNWVTNPETGKLHLGRFGWKASKATLRQQAGDALIKDIGVTSPVYPSIACQKGVGDCRTAVGATALSETEISRMANYLMLLAVPAQHSLRSGFPDGARVSPEHDVDPAQIIRGRALFAQARCVSCHTAEMKTSKNHPFAELRDQTIHPYTNMLLHDMGPEMADTLSEGKANPSLWRTAPLWGLGSLLYVQSSVPKGDATTVRYLHDGRARTLNEAIGWHGGEASAARANFEAMSKADRDALLTFLRSL